MFSSQTKRSSFQSDERTTNLSQDLLVLFKIEYEVSVVKFSFNFNELKSLLTFKISDTQFEGFQLKKEKKKKNCRAVIRNFRFLPSSI